MMVLISLQQFHELRTQSCSLRLITSLILEVCLDGNILCNGQVVAMAGMMQCCCMVVTITSANSGVAATRIRRRMLSPYLWIGWLICLRASRPKGGAL